MGSSSRESIAIYAILLLSLVGMVIASVMVFDYNQKKTVESFLSCGSTCHVGESFKYFNVFGFVGAQVQWILFALLTVLALTYHRTKLWRDRIAHSILAIAVIGVVLAAYGLYAVGFELMLPIVQALISLALILPGWIIKTSLPMKGK